jgi:hypothetical protein
LQVTNFGFEIPSGATIDGVTVTIERKANYNSASMYVQDYTLKLIKDGEVGGDSKADTTSKWPTADASVNYGGTSDTWGNTFTHDDINDSTFGVELIAARTTVLKSSVTASVDFISITVTYTESGGGASAVPAIMNSYRQRRN